MLRLFFRAVSTAVGIGCWGENRKPRGLTISEQSSLDQWEKIMVNGHLLIRRNGVVYNVGGERVE